MPIVTDTGFSFQAAPDYIPAADIEKAAGPELAVLLANDDAPETLAPYFDKIVLIAVAFPSFADGRGFSIACRLRDLGYAGRLRATGHMITDQYASARACGFDEVEIDDALAARQPEAHWQAAAAIRISYQRRLAPGQD